MVQNGCVIMQTVRSPQLKFNLEVDPLIFFNHSSTQPSLPKIHWRSDLRVLRRCLIKSVGQLKHKQLSCKRNHPEWKMTLTFPYEAQFPITYRMNQWRALEQEGSNTLIGLGSTTFHYYNIIKRLPPIIQSLTRTISKRIFRKHHLLFPTIKCVWFYVLLDYSPL